MNTRGLRMTQYIGWGFPYDDCVHTCITLFVISFFLCYCCYLMAACYTVNDIYLSIYIYVPVTSTIVSSIHESLTLIRGGCFRAVL